MTPDEMEAESWRYSVRVLRLVPLSSGSIAVLTSHHEIFRIVSGWDEAKALGPSANPPQVRALRPIALDDIEL